MKKSTLNFLIDGIMFLLMGLLAGIGLLIKFVLLSGEDRWIIYGKNVDITFWGLDRHEWGRIHLIVAIILIVFLVLHIIFHWKIIICLCKGLISGKAFRFVIAVAFSIITVLLVIFPFLIKIEVHDLASGKERFKEHVEQANIEPRIKEETKDIESNEEITGENQEAEHHNIDPSIEVKGYLTLMEVSEKYNVPCEFIKSKLNIPENVSNSSKLGQLKKTYNFKMSEIETLIFTYKK